MTTQSAPPELTDGFRVFVDALKLNGVDTIYGLVGIPITGLARIAQKSGIRFIGFRHETSAGNAAAAAGFLTRRPGVCLTVWAPGFLNGLVALANATTNCFPMIQISGSASGTWWTCNAATTKNWISFRRPDRSRRRRTASAE